MTVRKTPGSFSRTKALAGKARAAATQAVEAVDAGFLESLIGYSLRRASLAMTGVSADRMQGFDLKIAEFSLLSLVGRNPGVTSRQLCAALDLLPPNMVGMIDALVGRGLLERRPHPSDGRAMGLYLTAQAEGLVHEAEQQIQASEKAAVQHWSAAEQKQLLQLLQKLYR
ncbi:MarR family winged helix-turn-helix transcriptional regulator [Comamonas composti]|uniref:MarR family winged helix-turn-helix transcriptional regulator n=1 Tax=Comamonas composti TaxID=408558 RepID=UPI000401EE75|nr:MarR family transcriptional regulator [Comamonas composti]